ncbi:hypothetical protein EDB89DRAFT_1912489 [Lactarius sanguifluus]|nr:hypothetical protein EDB89DRAFT_1912489 [Lactarius sanguifluus]
MPLIVLCCPLSLLLLAVLVSCVLCWGRAVLGLHRSPGLCAAGRHGGGVAGRGRIVAGSCVACCGGVVGVSQQVCVVLAGVAVQGWSRSMVGLAVLRCITAGCGQGVLRVVCGGSGIWRGMGLPCCGGVAGSCAMLAGLRGLSVTSRRSGGGGLGSSGSEVVMSGLVEAVVVVVGVAMRSGGCGVHAVAVVTRRCRVKVPARPWVHVQQTAGSVRVAVEAVAVRVAASERRRGCSPTTTAVFSTLSHVFFLLCETLQGPLLLHTDRPWPTQDERPRLAVQTRQKFNSEAILSRRGPLAKVWLAALMERKLSKARRDTTVPQQAVLSTTSTTSTPPRESPRSNITTCKTHHDGTTRIPTQLSPTMPRHDPGPCHPNYDTPPPRPRAKPVATSPQHGAQDLATTVTPATQHGLSPAIAVATQVPPTSHPPRHSTGLPRTTANSLRYHRNKQSYD